MNAKNILRPELGLMAETAELGIVPLVPFFWALSVPLTAWLITRKLPEPLPPEMRKYEIPLWVKIALGTTVALAAYVVIKKGAK